MATTKPIPIQSQPGIRRDGTLYDGQEYSSGLWTRFYRGRPKKMGGYRAVTSTIPEIVRGMNSFTADATNYYALGGSSTLTQVQTDSNGDFLSEADRMGAVVTDAENLWQMTIFNNSNTGAANSLVVHAAPNLDDISSTVERNIYYGTVDGTDAMVATAMDPCSGGIISIYPYLFGYGNGGRIDVSPAGSLTTPNDSAFVTGQKIVRGLPLRGGGAGPAALFWSLDSLVRATFDATITTGVPFDFDTISDQSSILSSQGVLEYDGIYFWAGVDRFLMFNGVVREVPNTMNLSFFFDNINFTERQKAFTFKIPRWGEVWFCAPLGNATECNHAIVYNVRENTWYDTALPGAGRSLGYFASVFNKPLMTDLTVDPLGGGFTLWQHETGTDQINGGNVQPIRANITSDEKDFLDQGLDKAMRVDVVEPDLVQVGDMTITVVGRANPRAADTESVTVTFPEFDGTAAPPLDAQDQVVEFSYERRLLRFTLESNTAGGDFYLGKTMAHVEPTDGRITQ